MKIIARISLWGLVLFGAPPLAADLRAKPMATTADIASIQFSVPYSFSNVHHELDHAVIRCVAQLAPKTPPIAAGQTTITLKGQPKTGTAIVNAIPFAGQKLSDARHYTCEMQVSNGKMTVVPQPTGFDWARLRSGSTVIVKGQIR